MIAILFLAFGVVSTFPTEQASSIPILGNLSDEKSLHALNITSTISPSRQEDTNFPKERTQSPTTTQTRIPCGIPEIPKLGNVTYIESNNGVFFVTYHCPSGYLLEGKTMRQCDNKNRKWSGIQPICKPSKNSNSTKLPITISTLPTVPPAFTAIPSNINNAIISNLSNNQLPEGINKISDDTRTIILTEKPNDKSMDSHTIANIFIAVGIFLLVFLIAGLFCYWMRMKKKPAATRVPNEAKSEGNESLLPNESRTNGP